MSRDMTIFIDDDGKAYHIYSSEENLTLQIAQLTDDYMQHNGLLRTSSCRWDRTRLQPSSSRMAPTG